MTGSLTNIQKKIIEDNTQLYIDSCAAKGEKFDSNKFDLLKKNKGGRLYFHVPGVGATFAGGEWSDLKNLANKYAKQYGRRYSKGIETLINENRHPEVAKSDTMTEESGRATPIRDALSSDLKAISDNYRPKLGDAFLDAYQKFKEAELTAETDNDIATRSHDITPAQAEKFVKEYLVKELKKVAVATGTYGIFDDKNSSYIQNALIKVIFNIDTDALTEELAKLGKVNYDILNSITSDGLKNATAFFQHHTLRENVTQSNLEDIISEMQDAGFADASNIKDIEDARTAAGKYAGVEQNIDEFKKYLSALGNAPEEGGDDS